MSLLFELLSADSFAEQNGMPPDRVSEIALASARVLGRGKNGENLYADLELMRLCIAAGVFPLVRAVPPNFRNIIGAR